MTKVPLNQRIKFIAENYFNGNKSKMGKLLNVAYQHVNNWILDKNNPKLETFLSLYVLIQDKVNPLWYLTGVGEPNLVNKDELNIVSEAPEKYQSSYYEKIIAEKNLLITNQQELIELLKKANK